MATRLDLQTLKTMIVELRDKNGLSFQEISDTLKSEYDIDKSRQAISGLYNRVKKQDRDNIERQKLVMDTVNLYCILDSATSVCNELARAGIDITYRQVLSILKDNEGYIDKVHKSIVETIETQIDKIDDITPLVRSLDYKGVQISEKRFSEYLEEACKFNIKNSIIRQLLRVYKLSSSMSAIRNVAHSFGVELKTSDLRAVL